MADRIPPVYFDLNPPFFWVADDMPNVLRARNGTAHLVRVGLGGDLEVPEFRREVLRVCDPLPLDYRVPGRCLGLTRVSETSRRSVSPWLELPPRVTP